MPTAKIKSGTAFLLLAVSIFLFRHSRGSPGEYLMASGCVMLFWYLLGLRLAFSNLRNILLIIAIFTSLLMLSQWLFPSPGETSVGLMLKGDLNPSIIGRLKKSHQIALVLKLERPPTHEGRYYRVGELFFTEDGLHYTQQKKVLNTERMPKTAAWVRQNLQGKHLNEDVEKVHEWFHRSMTYSLSPGSLNSTFPLDEFLFDQRTGFCEHFAAGLATILSLKDYKARVVFGYAGGSWNRFLKILTYEDSDAHAWVEVAQAGTASWKIVDPTNWVYPSVLDGQEYRLNFFWLGMSTLFLAAIIGFFLLRHDDAMESVVRKMEIIEKKHRLESRGLTLSERLVRIAELPAFNRERVLESQKLYLQIYDPKNSGVGLEKALKRSMGDWR